MVAKPCGDRPVEGSGNPVAQAGFRGAHDDHRGTDLGGQPAQRPGRIPCQRPQRPVDAKASQAEPMLFRNSWVTARISALSVSGCSESRCADRAGSHSTR